MENLKIEAKVVPEHEISNNATTVETLNNYSYTEYQGSAEAITEQIPNGVDTNSIEYAEQIPNGIDMKSIKYWESLYPGWKYDPFTGQWYQA